MYKRIYVPVDDSKASNLALIEACKLAQALDSQIQLVHVVDLAYFGWGSSEFHDKDELHKAAKATAQQVLSLAERKAYDAGLTPSSKMIEGWGDSIAQLLYNDATAWGADLIVMGTHGWTGPRAPYHG